MAEQARRPAKGSIANYMRKIMKWLNIFVIGAAVVAAISIFVIKGAPTFAGWAFILVAALTLLSGVIGCLAPETCFSLHFLALGLSMGGLGSSALALFIKRDLVEEHLKSNRSRNHVHGILKFDAVFFLIILSAQLIILVMSFVLHHCSAVSFYEDIETKTAKREHQLGKVQEDATARAAKQEEAKAAELDRKLKQKYGKFTFSTDAEPDKK